MTYVTMSAILERLLKAELEYIVDKPEKLNYHIIAFTNILLIYLQILKTLLHCLTTYNYYFIELGTRNNCTDNLTQF